MQLKNVKVHLPSSPQHQLQVCRIKNILSKYGNKCENLICLPKKLKRIAHLISKSGVYYTIHREGRRKKFCCKKCRVWICLPTKLWPERVRKRGAGDAIAFRGNQLFCKSLQHSISPLHRIALHCTQHALHCNCTTNVHSTQSAAKSTVLKVWCIFVHTDALHCTHPSLHYK